MRIEYQLTEEDYGEVARWHNQMNLWPIIWLLALATTVTPLSGQILYPYVPPPPGVTEPPPPYSLLRDTVFPLLFWVVLIPVAWLLVRQLIRQTRKPWLRKPPSPAASTASTAWLLPSIAFGVLFTAVILLALQAIRVKQALLARPGVRADPNFNPALDTLLPLLPALLFTAVVGVFVRRMKHVYKRTWQSQTQLHRRFEAEIADQGLTIREMLSTTSYRWAYFPGFVETPNLFVLYISPQLMQLIPKRALAGPGEVDWFRGLLAHVVREPAGAFPVVRTPPPLPAARGGAG